MMDYWIKQTGKPAFPNIEWEKPEQRALAGKLLILGGNQHGFAAVAQAYSDALAAGAGECRVVLPDALKKVVDASALDCLFAPTNPSGGLSKEGVDILQAGAAWANAMLFIGDAGRNSETAILFEQLLRENPKLAIITRDALDLLRAPMPQLVERPNTVLVASLAQLQKIFQSVYYPKTILFSMQLTSLVEALHKFTITHPVALVVFHQNQLVVAHQGKVSSTPWDEPLMIWRGTVASQAAVYGMQHPGKLFEAVTTALVA